MSKREKNEETGSIQGKKPQGSLGLRHSRNNKVYYEQYPLARAFRLSLDLDREVLEYLRQNSISFNQLCHLALSQFISVPQKIELVPVANLKRRLWGETRDEPPLVSLEPKRRVADKDESPQRGVRFTLELDLRIQEYLVKNDLSFSQLCQFAMGKFISTRQALELLAVSESPSSDWQRDPAESTTLSLSP